ncbi:RagB/SusD family nutrient uptake outer membrane protein, partial [Myroides odoratimimus]|uniref:RagB/SusD family nutrient uptake outer membrane protein n=1 Tax=Myroides odoratimimus TaxID=76832 RepID=UPI002DBCD8F7
SSLYYFKQTYYLTLAYEIWAWSGGYSPTSDNLLLFNNTLDPSKYVLSSIWNTSYTHIYTINAFIIGVSKSNGISEEEKEQLISEGLILRSLYYQSLTQLFGDIPYTISTDYKENTQIEKTPYHQVLQNIEQDILQAKDVLSYSYRSSNKYYPNKTVAELILAKNHLLQKKYDKAEIIAKLILNNSLYNLELDLSKTFKNSARSTLWQLSNSSPIAATYEARNYVMLSGNWLYNISSSLINSFDNNDLRTLHWIKEYIPTSTSYNYKYKNTPTNNTDENSIIFRLEEAYFILSEALIHQDKEKEAIPYLNIIRQKAGLSPLSNSLNKEQIILSMLDESRKEFFLEHGRRFFDLKRNNKLSLLKDTKTNWQDKHAFFPYPEKEILINPNLNPQNEY